MLSLIGNVLGSYYTLILAPTVMRQREFYLNIKSERLFTRVLEHLNKKYTVYTAIYNGRNGRFRVSY